MTTTWHADRRDARALRDGALDDVRASSLEAHLLACDGLPRRRWPPRVPAPRSTHVARGRRRGRRAAARARGTRAARPAACRTMSARLLAATPSLRLSWLARGGRGARASRRSRPTSPAAATPTSRASSSWSSRRCCRSPASRSRSAPASTRPTRSARPPRCAADGCSLMRAARRARDLARPSPRLRRRSPCPDSTRSRRRGCCPRSASHSSRSRSAPGPSVRGGGGRRARRGSRSWRSRPWRARTGSRAFRPAGQAACLAAIAVSAAVLARRPHRLRGRDRDMTAPTIEIDDIQKRFGRTTRAATASRSTSRPASPACSGPTAPARPRCCA